MSVRHLLATTPAAAHISVQRAADVYAMSSGRIWAIVAALTGLAGAIVGGLALARRGGIGSGRRAGVVAGLLGLVGVIIGGLVVATADGGLGTGNGLGGGVVAMAVGLIGMVLGGYALARSRRGPTG